MKEFERLTLELLKHKYRYYILNQPTISDYNYDVLETKWVNLGLAAGVDMDNYAHWVDFDENHPMAAEAKKAVENK